MEMIASCPFLPNKTVSQPEREGRNEEASAGEEGPQGSPACFRKATVDLLFISFAERNKSG